MSRWRRSLFRAAVIGIVFVLTSPGHASAQGTRWLPDRALMPDLIAGPRDPVTKTQVLLVTDNPNALEEGVEVEVALGTKVPVLHLGDISDRGGLIIGLEAGVFARFGLQVLHRELIATDWMFAVPFLWNLGDHWIRARYYHTSSHLGDEYSNRFEVQGVNFSRDALDALGRFQLLPALATYGGVSWAYNVHPEDSEHWTVRVGVEAQATGNARWVPYATMDVQTERDNEWRPRLTAQVGIWLPEVRGRRSLRFGAEFLSGPSPLGQFQGRHTRQLALGIFGSI